MPHAQRWTARLALVTSVLLLAGAGCAKAKPEDVLRQAQVRLAQSTSAGFDERVTLRVDAPGVAGKRNRVDIAFRANGASAKHAQGDDRSTATMTVEVSADAGRGKGAFAFRLIGQTMYLKLEDLTLTSSGSEQERQQLELGAGAVKGMIGGKWMKFDPQEIAALAAQSGASAVKVLTPDELRALQSRVEQQLTARPLLTFRQDLGKERVGKVSAYRYRVGIDWDAVIDLIGAYAGAVGQPAGFVDQVRLAFAEPKVRALLDRAGGEVWVAKRSKDIVRLRFPIDLAGIEGFDGSMTGELDMTFRNWGKPVSVEAPSDAVSLRQFLAPFLPGASPPPTPPTPPTPPATLPAP